MTNISEFFATIIQYNINIEKSIKEDRRSQIFTSVNHLLIIQKRLSTSLIHNLFFYL